MEHIYNVDRVFVINLDSRPDRWTSMKRKIIEAGFSESAIKRIPAVLGKSLDLSQVNLSDRARYDLQQVRDNHFSIATTGAVGCYLSHYNLWKRMVDENIEAALIFEDDAQFTPNFQEKSKAVMHDLHRFHWDHDGLLFLQTFNVFPIKEKYEPTESKYIKRITGAFGSCAAYRITLDAARILVDKANLIDVQVDAAISFIGLNPDNHLRLLATRPVIVETDVVDIFTGNIQSVCAKCLIPPENEYIFGFFTFVGILLALSLFLLYYHFRK